MWNARIRCALVLFSLISVCCHAADDAIALITKGEYIKVQKGETPREKAAWAFANYYLKPGRDVAEAARAAHEAKEPLGTFVLLLCQRSGVGLRQDEAVLHKLNFELRTQLEKVKDPTPLEEYMHSRLMEGDEKGVVTTKDPDKSLDDKFKNQDRRSERLTRSAERGVAQALNEIGEAHQESENWNSAYEFYARAAKSGLAAGLKNQGFMVMEGRGCTKNQEQALKLTQDAAERGDIYAIINVGMFCERGMGREKSSVEARKWIDRAAASGHYDGAFEKGLALLMGNYGYEKNPANGIALLQQAASSGSGTALFRLANWYGRGIGLKLSGSKAVAFAEGAFVQGEEQAAGLLAYAYDKGLDDVKPNKERAVYWQGRMHASLAFAVGLTDDDHPMVKYLKTVDPFKLKVE